MKKIVKNFLKAALSKTGYELKKKSNELSKLEFTSEKYRLCLKEIETLHESTFGSSLPSNDNRVNLLQALLGTNPSEAFYILHYINKAITLNGDICEFGIAQGSTSALMSNEIFNTSKNIWLFDSFEGLPMPTEKDLLKDDIFNLGSMKAYAGTMASGLDMVTEKLKEINFPFQRVKIIPGFIEETIKLDTLPNQVCFAYVDFDFYEPIKIALNFLDNVLTKNGYVIVDDYDWFSTGAKSAVDEFIAAHPKDYAIYIPDKRLGHFCVISKV